MTTNTEWNINASFSFMPGYCKILSSIFFVLVILSSCSGKEKVPKDILPKDKMQEVLWSMVNAGEFLNGFVLRDSVDSAAERSKIYGQVFQIHHISKEEFDKSYLYYRQHPELMKPILDSLVKRQTVTNEPVPQKADSLKNADSLKKADSVPKKMMKDAVVQ